MNDLIDRNELIEEFRKCHISFNGTLMEESDMMISYRSLARVINRQPTVEAKPVVHGEWDKYRISKLFKYTCSVCHCDTEEKTPFCPWCGADMRGGKNE